MTKKKQQMIAQQVIPQIDHAVYIYILAITYACIWAPLNTDLARSIHRCQFFCPVLTIIHLLYFQESQMGRSTVEESVGWRRCSAVLAIQKQAH